MNCQVRCFLAITIFIATGVSCLQSEIPFAKTPLGQINGFYKSSARGRRYAAFESVPYALPPTGELRFQPPVSISKYPEVINATEPPVYCVQYHTIDNLVKGKEDCLYLNIYVPNVNSPGLLPVIFWIHGGGFQYGTSTKYGPKYLMDKDLILVTINYRLGPFGFLSTGDNVVSGNMGLKDQSMALRWVSDNIRYFNGDRNRITLMGVSAGGASVHYHYLSPMSAGLFRHGISFSGTALGRWAYNHDTSETARILARALNCPTNDSRDMVQCLKTISATDMAKTVQRLLSKLYFSYAMFPPVAEKIDRDYFINDSPTNIIQKGKSNDVPWITGVVSEEGLYITGGFALKDNLMAYTDAHWESVAPIMLHYPNTIPKSKHSQLVNLAKRHYLGDRPITTDRKAIKDLTHLAGDDQITTGSIRAAKFQAKAHESPVWFYHYTYRAAHSTSDYFSNSTENLGVSHDDDVYLVLENDFMDPTTTPSDRLMLKYMLNHWESVAQTGEPNLETQWPRLDPSKNFSYMHISGPGNFTMETNDNLGEIKFWESIGL
ncbi:venom carboxylesterase-6-like [Copidosoma floridanum]|uniref:venom carboxylesterase-6-like n=1 Tax=Copidosoma floridanum TaxID=29053 RepID=UPI0006C9BB18|nr:venom carboxylesterase-6-like [Copidosoma floridanum]